MNAALRILASTTTLALLLCSRSPAPDGSSKVASPLGGAISSFFDRESFHRELAEQRLKRTKRSDSIYFVGDRPFFRNKACREDVPLMRREALRPSAELVLPQDIDPLVEKYRDYITHPEFLLGAEGIPADPSRLKMRPELSPSHRSRQSPVQDQGGRNTCVAFAAVGDLEAILGGKIDLSEESAYHDFMIEKNSNCCKDAEIITAEAAQLLARHEVPEERIFPYHRNAPGCQRTTSCGPVHAPVAGSTTTIEVTGYVLIGDAPSHPQISIRNPAYLESWIDQGYDVAFGFAVAWDPDDAGGVIHVVSEGENNEPAYGDDAGHAVLLIGYDHDAKFFIAKDSQGLCWGHDGYLHIGYDYVREYGRSGFVITRTTTRRRA